MNPNSTTIGNLDMKRDVVATEHDLHRSSYFVTRAWITDFEAHCTRSGKSFVVRRAEIDARRKLTNSRRSPALSW